MATIFAVFVSLPVFSLDTEDNTEDHDLTVSVDKVNVLAISDAAVALNISDTFAVDNDNSTTIEYRHNHTAPKDISLAITFNNATSVANWKYVGLKVQMSTVLGGVATNGDEKILLTGGATPVNNYLAATPIFTGIVAGYYTGVGGALLNYTITPAAGLDTSEKNIKLTYTVSTIL